MLTESLKSARRVYHLTIAVTATLVALAVSPRRSDRYQEAVDEYRALQFVTEDFNTVELDFLPEWLPPADRIHLQLSRMPFIDQERITSVLNEFALEQTRFRRTLLPEDFEQLLFSEVRDRLADSLDVVAVIPDTLIGHSTSTLHQSGLYDECQDDWIFNTCAREALRMTPDTVRVAQVYEADPDTMVTICISRMTSVAKSLSHLKL